MRRYWRAQLIFEVTATDIDMAFNKAFVVFIDACRTARSGAEGQIINPLYHLDNPNPYQPYLGRTRVYYPAPAEPDGEKTPHRVPLDVQYVKVEDDWGSVAEARQWLADFFRQHETPDVRLVHINDSIILWS